MLYLEENSLPGSDKLLSTIKDSLKNYEIIMPVNRSNEFVFAYYIELKDLTDEWIADFCKCARDFQRKMPINIPEQQHHVVYFRFTVAGLEPEEFREKARLVNKLISEDTDISKEVFMLRSMELESFEKQATERKEGSV